MLQEEELKLYCGFCLHVDTYTKRKSVGNGKKVTISNTIHCNKCNKKLNKKNEIK